ncbi:hypothetical protein MMC28_002677 [Mycoblastus sanguinarius]|nr:hypothetical protein [Mycoblastus sanguinarius]
MTRHAKMPAFSRFPNEIVYQILQHVLPEDLENLAQTSRHVRLVSLPLLADHRARVRKYSTLTLNAAYPGPPERLLKDMLVNPLNARYITRLKSDSWRVTEKERGYTVERATSTDMDLFAATASDSEYLNDPAADSSNPNYWREQTEYFEDTYEDSSRIFNPDLLLAILLPLLPNLAVFDLRWPQDEFDHWLLDMLECIPKAKTPALTKLKCVRLDSGYSLDYVKAFSTLPSVEKVTAPDLSPGNARSKKGNEPPLVCYVKNLELYESIVGPRAIHHFLLRCEDLQSFSCSHVDYPETSETFDASLIRTALLDHVTGKLRKLTLLAPEQKSMFMGSLRSFKVLQDICIDWDLLLPDQGNGVTAEVLSEMLPASLQILGVHDENGHQKCDYESLVESTALSRSSELADLTELNITYKSCDPIALLSNDTCDILLHRCSNVGVALTFAKLDSRYHPARIRSGQAFEEAEVQQKARDDSYEDWINNSGLDPSSDR